MNHKGVEMVAVATGLVQVVLATGRPVLRAGETLLAERSGISSWRNVGDREALLFWILRDELGAVDARGAEAREGGLDRAPESRDRD